MNKLIALILAVSFTTTNVFAVDTVWPTDKGRLGKNSSSADKIFEFQDGLATNPAFKSTPSAADIRALTDSFSLGFPATGANKSLKFDIGAGASNPVIRWNTSTQKFESAPDGSTFATLGSGGGGSGVNYITNSDAEGGTSGYTVFNGQNTVTITIASPAVFTSAAAHGLAVGDPIAFSTTGALPTGLTAGTVYYVSAIPSSTTYRVSTSVGGADVATSGSQSGTHTETPLLPRRLANPNVGGAAAVTFTATSSSPLRGLKSFLLTHPASNTAGQGVYYDFTINNVDQGASLAINFEYQVASGTYTSPNPPAIGAGTDLQVWVYDKTNGTLIQPAGTYVVGNSVGVNGKFTGVFQAPINSTSYRLILVESTTNSAAYTLAADTVSVGPQSFTSGAAITDWQQYTPAFTGFGTVSSQTVFYRRNGDSIDVQGYFTAGTTTAVEARIGLPAGFVSAGSSKLPAITLVGKMNVNSVNAGFFSGATMLIEQNQTYLTMGAETSTLNGVTKQNASAFVATGQLVSFYARGIPISGLSSNTTMSTDTDTRVVSFYGTQSSQAATAGVTDIAYTTTKDTHGAWNGTQYIVPVPGDYMVTWAHTNSAVNHYSSVYKNGSFFQYGVFQASSGQSDGGSILVPALKAGDTLSIRTGTTGTIATGSVGIFRLSGPSTVAASEKVAARFKSNSARTMNNTAPVLVYELVDYDTHSAYNTSTGVYTCPTPGYYLISGAFSTVSTAFSGGAFVGIGVFKNGTVVGYFAKTRAQAAYTGYLESGGSTTVQCNTGDQITIRGASDTATTTIADPVGNFISISLIK